MARMNNRLYTESDFSEGRKQSQTDWPLVASFSVIALGVLAFWAVVGLFVFKAL